MANMLVYKGFSGTVEFSFADRVFYGKIFGINDLISYEGRTVDEIEKAFQEAVEEYLEICKAMGKEPEKTFKGNFNVRIKPELHKLAAYEATVRGISLNDFVEASIASGLGYADPTLAVTVAKKEIEDSTSKSGKKKALSQFTSFDKTSNALRKRKRKTSHR